MLNNDFTFLRCCNSEEWIVIFSESEKGNRGLKNFGKVGRGLAQKEGVLLRKGLIFYIYFPIISL